MFMKDIYRSLTENNGEAGILKNLFEENELDDLKTNSFHITGSDIRAINESDVIMCFANRGHQEELGVGFCVVGAE